MRCSVCRTKLVAIQIEYIAPKKNKKSLRVLADGPAAGLMAAEPRRGGPADALDLGL